MKTNNRLFLTMALVVGTLFYVSSAQAQGTRNNWVGPVGVEAAWNQGDLGTGEGVNWAIGTQHLQPDGDFGEYGSISNGGIAVIQSAIGFDPVDIRLGQDGGTTGTLVVRNGGSITVASNSTFTGTTGGLYNGGGGSGTLVLRDNMGSVSLERYLQTGGSTLVAQLSNTGTFTNRVQVSQAVTLNGTLRVERTPGSSFTVTNGNSWTIMQGAPVNGNFSSVQLDPALRKNAGQVIRSSTASNAVTFSVEQRLVLEVDRFTGATTLRNPAGHTTPIELISYSLASPSNGVSGAANRWNSFQADPGKPGWSHANPSGTVLSELNATGSLTMTSGQSHNFGTPINANTSAPLGTNRVNVGGVTMQYLLPNGTLADAVVEGVGRFNDLVLVVHPTTGVATLQNQSSQSVEFISYTISSASGALNTSWTGLTGTPSQPNWFKANPTPNNLSELNSVSSSLMSVGTEYNLGATWLSAGARDLTFQYQTTDGALRFGTVHYGDKAVIPSTGAGDFDGDGDVDGRDFLLWQRNPSIGSLADWQSNYGSGALAAEIHSVPEPSAMTMGFACITAFLWQRRRR